MVAAPSIYSIQDNGKRMTRIASGTPRPAAAEEDNRPRGMRGGFRGGMSNLKLTKDGRTLFFQEGESVYTTPVSGGGGGAAAVSPRPSPRRPAAAAARRGRRGCLGRRAPQAQAAAGAESASMSPSRSTSPRNGTRCSTTPGDA